MSIYLRIGLFFHDVLGHKLFRFIYFDIIYRNTHYTKMPEYWSIYTGTRKVRKQLKKFLSLPSDEQDVVVARQRKGLTPYSFT